MNDMMIWYMYRVVKWWPQANEHISYLTLFIYLCLFVYVENTSVLLS